MQIAIYRIGASPTPVSSTPRADKPSLPDANMIGTAVTKNCTCDSFPTHFLVHDQTLLKSYYLNTGKISPKYSDIN